MSEWALSHGMGLKLVQSFVSYSLNLCSIFIPTHIVDRINYGLKVLWLVGVVILPFESLACLQEVVISSSISTVVSSLGTTFIDSCKVPIP